MSIDAIAASLPAPPSPDFSHASIGKCSSEALHGDSQSSHISKVLTAIGNATRSLLAHLRSPFTRTVGPTLDTDSPPDIKANANVRLLKATFQKLETVAPGGHAPAPETLPNRQSWLFDVAPNIKTSWDAAAVSEPLPRQPPPTYPAPSRRESSDSGSASSLLYSDSLRRFFFPDSSSRPLPADPAPSRRDSIDSFGSASSLIFRMELESEIESDIESDMDSTYEETDSDSWTSEEVFVKPKVVSMGPDGPRVVYVPKDDASEPELQPSHAINRHVGSYSDDRGRREDVFVEPRVVSLAPDGARIVEATKAEKSQPLLQPDHALKRRLDSNSDDHGNRFATIRSRPTPLRPSLSLGSIEDSDADDNSLPSIEEEADRQKELQLFAEREILRNAAYTARMTSFYI
jgi:hypothetical protein